MRLPTIVLYSAQHPEGQAIRIHGFAWVLGGMCTLLALLGVSCILRDPPGLLIVRLLKLLGLGVIMVLLAKRAFTRIPLAVPPPHISAHQQVQFLTRVRRFGRLRPYRIRWALTH